MLDMRAETHVDFRIKCPLLLSDCNQNYNVSTNITEIRQHKISLISVQQFWSCYMQTDRQTHCNCDKRIFATFRCDRANKG